MMNSHFWAKCQVLVDAGQGHLVKHHYIEELENNLTEEQLQKLGDISLFLDQAFKSKNKMQPLIKTIIEMSKQGAILGQRKN